MLICLVGPTGSGKTDIAIKLADFYHAPIINADAFQIYQEMDIGTAKIAKDDPYYQKHYLIDIVKPNQSYSVKQYQDDFRHIYNSLKEKYQTIIVCGGTGLYLKAALYDYQFDDEDKNDNGDLEKMSNEELYALLIKLDPKATETIHINNRKRVIRAINIALNHDLNKSENIALQEHKLIIDDEVKFIFLNPPREALYERINERVDKMMEMGLVDEVKNLLNKYQLSNTAKAAIGYKEVIAYLDNEISLEDCVELIKKRSRNYAKRQVTFFKHQLPCIEYHSAAKILEDYIL